MVVPSGVDTDAIIRLGQHLQTTVKEFYPLTITQLTFHPLFATVINNASDPSISRMFHAAFGNRNATDASSVMAGLDHNDRCVRGLILLGFLTSGSTTFVGARMYSRWLTREKFRLDDHLIGLALGMSSWVQLVEIVDCVVWKTGHHLWDVTFEKYKLCLLIGWIVEWTYYPTLFLLKSSILIFYFYLLSAAPFLKFASKALWVVLLLGNAWIFVNIFQCTPIAYWRDPLNRKCLDQKKLLSSVGYFSIFTDFLLLMLPMSVLPRLRLRPREKILISALFVLGGFTCIASICRLLSINTLVRTEDWTYHATQTGIWAFVEIHTGIMCACAPHLKGLVYRYAPSVKKFVTPVLSKISTTASSLSGKTLSTIGGSGGKGRKRRVDQFGLSTFGTVDTTMHAPEDGHAQLGAPEIGKAGAHETVCVVGEDTSAGEGRAYDDGRDDAIVEIPTSNSNVEDDLEAALRVRESKSTTRLRDDGHDGDAK